jgi:hypothetical protein
MPATVFFVFGMSKDTVLLFTRVMYVSLRSSSLEFCGLHAARCHSARAVLELQGLSPDANDHLEVLPGFGAS